MGSSVTFICFSLFKILNLSTLEYKQKTMRSVSAGKSWKYEFESQDQNIKETKIGPLQGCVGEH